VPTRSLSERAWRSSAGAEYAVIMIAPRLMASASTSPAARSFQVVRGVTLRQPATAPTRISAPTWITWPATVTVCSGSQLQGGRDRGDGRHEQQRRPGQPVPHRSGPPSRELHAANSSHPLATLTKPPSAPYLPPAANDAELGKQADRAAQTGCDQPKLLASPKVIYSPHCGDAPGGKGTAKAFSRNEMSV
jgi:hypothetical protein